MSCESSSHIPVQPLGIPSWVSPFHWKYRHLLAKHSYKNQSDASHNSQAKYTVVSAMLLVWAKVAKHVQTVFDISCFPFGAKENLRSFQPTLLHTVTARCRYITDQVFLPPSFNLNIPLWGYWALQPPHKSLISFILKVFFFLVQDYAQRH